MEVRQEFHPGASANPRVAIRLSFVFRWLRLFAFIAFSGTVVPNLAHGQGGAFTIGDYKVVNSARVSRLEDEFTVKADLTNSGAAASNVLCVVTSTSANTVVTRGSLLFASIGAGATLTSTDTFTIRQNRVASFDPSALQWQFTVNAPVFNVTIATPADGLLTNASTVQVTGTTSAAAASVKINTNAATVSGNTFQADILLLEGGNTLTAVAIGPLGQVATTSIYVTRDSQPPRLAIDAPTAGATVSTDRITVTGTINDTVIGTVNDAQCSVTVNGVAAICANRTFVAMNVPLTAGANTLTATGTDRAGNVGAASVNVTYSTAITARVQPISGDGQTALIGATLPTPLVVLATNEQGTPAPGKDVIFKVCQNDGVVTGGGRTARSVIVPTGPDGKAQVTFQIGTRVGAGNNQVQASVVGFQGVATFCASSTPAPAAMLVLDSGNRQTGVPGQPLPRPFVAIVVDSGNNRLANIPIAFTSLEGGGTFGGLSVKTINTDSDGRATATLVLGPEAGIENHRVQATFPGNTGLPVIFTASSMVPGDALQTSISGVVLDNSDVPVPGATVRILGTSRTGISSAQGQFLIKPVPVGTLRMAVDGSTVTRPGSWVNLDYDITTVAGQDNTIGMPVRLLQINTASGVNISPTQGGTITLPDYPGFSLKILPGSVTFPDGGGQTGTVTATVVHADKTPEVPNFGQQPRFIVSLNPKGCIFNPPAQMCIPNLDGHPPGQKTEMYSFDDSLHVFVSIGTGTVSTDGTQICSDPGSGVIRGGWHCGGNPAETARGLETAVSVAPLPIMLCKDQEMTITASGRPQPPFIDRPYRWTSGANVSISDPEGDGTATIKGIRGGTEKSKVTYLCKSAQSAEMEFDVTVIDVTIADVVRGTGIPNSLSPTKTYNIAVTITPSLPSGQFVEFEVDNGGDGDAGSATISSPTNKRLASSGNLTIKGGTQTEPGHAGKLKVKAKLSGMMECGKSNGFSVCAHPNAAENGPSHSAIDTATLAGLLIDIHIKSDSGSDADLDELMDSEVVSLSLGHTGSFVGFTPIPSNTSGFQQATTVPPDNHTIGKAFMLDRFDNHGGAGSFSKHQLDIFYCKRCGMVEADAIAIPNSGYEIIREVSSPSGTRVDVITTKNAKAVSVGAYSTGSGPSASQATTVKARN